MIMIVPTDDKSTVILVGHLLRHVKRMDTRATMPILVFLATMIPLKRSRMNSMAVRICSANGEEHHIPRTGTRDAVVTTDTRDLTTMIVVYTYILIFTFARASVITWDSIAMASSTHIAEHRSLEGFIFTMQSMYMVWIVILSISSEVDQIIRLYKFVLFEYFLFAVKRVEFKKK